MFIADLWMLSYFCNPSRVLKNYDKQTRDLLKSPWALCYNLSRVYLLLNIYRTVHMSHWLYNHLQLCWLSAYSMITQVLLSHRLMHVLLEGFDKLPFFIVTYCLCSFIFLTCGKLCFTFYCLVRYIQLGFQDESNNEGHSSQYEKDTATVNLHLAPPLWGVRKWGKGLKQWPKDSTGPPSSEAGVGGRTHLHDSDFCWIIHSVYLFPVWKVWQSLYPAFYLWVTCHQKCLYYIHINLMLHVVHCDHGFHFTAHGSWITWKFICSF